MTSSLKTALILLLLLAPALLYNLGDRPLSKIQEVRIAETAREMLVSGDWLVPRYNGELRLQKPPLPYWLTAASYRIFGVNATAVRLPAVLFGMLTAALLFARVRREAGTTAAANTILVLAASYIGIRYFRSGEADAMLMFFICAASILGYHMQQYSGKNKRYQLLFGLALGLGFLSKGPAALAVPLLALLATTVWNREPRKFLANFSLPGLLLLLLSAGAWYAWIFWQLPDAANLFFGRQIDQTFISGTHAKPAWWYLAHFFEFFAPWGFLLIPAGWWSYRQSRQTSLPPYARFSWVWLAVVFVLLTLTVNKQMQYALLLAPPLALVIGHYLASADGGFARANKILFAIFAAAIVAGLAYVFAHVTHSGAAVAALLIVVALPLLLKYLWQAEAPSYAALLVAAATVFAYLYSEDYVYREPRKAAAQTLMAKVDAVQPLYQLRIDTRPDDGAWSFYAGRVVVPVRIEQLPALLQLYPQIWLVSADKLLLPATRVELVAAADDLKLYKIQSSHD